MDQRSPSKLPRFARQVAELLSPALTPEAFLLARASAGPTFLAMVKRQGPNVCSYVFVRDDRAGDGEVRADLWVSPTDFPDDRIDALGLGFSLKLASTFEPADDFFRSVGGRLKIVSDSLPSLAAAVEREFSNPVLKTTARLARYLEETKAYRFAASCTGAASVLWARLHEVSRSVVTGVVRHDVLAANTLDFVRRCWTEDAERGALLAGSFGGDEQSLAAALADRLYVETLVGQ